MIRFKSDFIKNIFTYNLNEITHTKGLSFYGFCLSFSHIITFFFWNHTRVTHIYMTKNENALCWPDLLTCNFIRLPSPELATLILYFYLFISILSCLFFLNKKTVLYGYFIFTVSTLLKFVIFSMDYRLMGNYHYMHFIISFSYLFIPHKAHCIPFLIVLFYFFAGLLKIITPEWLTGMAIFKHHPSFINEFTFQLLCFFVVLLEMVCSWFLILRTKLKKIVFFAFLSFHTASWYFVGYYYPLIMYSLISIFPIKWLFHKNKSISLSKSLIPGIAFITFFIAFQIIPFSIKGDQALTGEGRLFALNMFDGNTDCSSQTVLKFKNKTIESNFSKNWLTVRIHCDPYIYFNRAKKICQFYKTDETFIDLSLTLISKLKSAVHYTTLINEKNFCSKKLSYSTWRKNKWIYIK